MKLLRDEKTVFGLETAFGILFLLYLALGCSSLTNGQSYVSLFMWLSYGLGGLLLCLRLLDWKNYIRMPGLGFLLAMCAVCVFSIAANLQYDVKRNVTYLIYWALCFFLLYTQSSQASPEKAKKRFAIMGQVFCLITFVLAVISLVMLVTLYSQVVTVNGAELTRGFVYGRLYGAYRTPNVGAVMAVISIMLSVHWMVKYKKVLYTIAAAVNILAQFLYIVFSDSRSGQVALALAGAVYVLFLAAGSQKLKKGAAKTVAVLLLTAATGLGLFFSPKLTQTAYNTILTQAAKKPAAVRPVTDADSTEPMQTDPTEPTVDLGEWVVDRGYDLSGDVSNRRFDIWFSGLEIFLQEPWLGTTFSGFQPYAQENMPETYIVNNDYLQMTTFDNDFVNLLVSNGIFALLAFLGFVAVLLTYLIRGFARMKTPDPDMPLAMSICTASASFSLFASGVLYMQEPFSAIFWMALGLMIVIIRQSKKESL